MPKGEWKILLKGDGCERFGVGCLAVHSASSVAQTGESIWSISEMVP
jgi:hypothetical protein